MVGARVLYGSIGHGVCHGSISVSGFLDAVEVVERHLYFTEVVM